MSEKLSEENTKVAKEPEAEEKEEVGLIESGTVGTEDELGDRVPNRSEARILNKVEDELESQEKVEKVIARVIESGFSGPIPPPNIISEYENIVPGSADRIIRMAEMQSEHRQHMEEIIVKAESRDSLLGVWFAFGLGIGCLVACIVMVVMVPEAAGVICGSILGVTGIGSIITAFLKNTRRRNDKDEQD